MRSIEETRWYVKGVVQPLLGSLAFLVAFGLVLSVLFSLKPRPVPPAPCTPAPWPREAALYTNGAVELPICRKGRLYLHLEGTQAAGMGPLVRVVEGERLLFSGEVRGERVLLLPLRGDGVVALGFTNDLYAPPEDRNLFLREVRFFPLSKP